MRRLSRDHFVNQLDHRHPPAYQVQDGETVVVETHDCHGGFVTREGVLQPGGPPANPATGPIAIEGARAGEGLAVTIHEVRPAEWGFIGGVEPPYTVVELREGQARYPWGLRLPIAPIIGVIGVAPPTDPLPTNTPSEWGGNLDTPDVRAGATLYLPVGAPGALLSLGDVHALQGDGEVCGTGIECAAEVVLTVRRLPEPVAPCPVVTRDDLLILVASAETLDAAAWRAVDEMAGLISRLTGLSNSQARRLLSTAGDLRISQIVNPKKTCRLVVPKQAIGRDLPF